MKKYKISYNNNGEWASKEVTSISEMLDYLEKGKGALDRVYTTLVKIEEWDEELKFWIWRCYLDY